MTNQWQYDPRQQRRPATPPQWQQPQYPPPYGYDRPSPPQYQQQPPARRRPDKRTVTVQSGSNGFHLFMTVITGGLWLIIWPLFRRKVRVTTRYR